MSAPILVEEDGQIIAVILQDWVVEPWLSERMAVFTHRQDESRRFYCPLDQLARTMTSIALTV